MNLIDLPTFIDAIRNFVSESPPDFDSETTLARNVALAVDQAGKALGLSSEPLLSADGFLWLYVNDIGIWQRVEINQLITIAQLFDGIFTTENKPSRIRIGWQRAGNIAKSIHRLHELQAPEFFKRPKPGIAFTNGFVVVSEYGPELEDHDSENAATIAYDFDLDEDCEPPINWLAFLDSLWPNDDDKESKKNVLQEFIGASIANIATRYQKCLLLIGTGSNGKSLLCDLIGELLFPEGTTTYVSPRRWDRDYSLASLKESRINLVSELPETSVLEQTDVFKAVVAGDLIEARLPYQPPFYLRPSAGHIFSANEIPRTGDTSDGFFRRFRIMTFNESFEDSPFRRTKEEIIADLEHEKAAIISWALHGAARLIRNGDYTRASSHKTVQDDWRKDSDSVFDFASSCLQFPSDSFTPLNEIREAFQDWAGRVGRHPDLASRTLAKRLRNIRGLADKRTSTGKSFGCKILPIHAWSDTSN